MTEEPLGPAMRALRSDVQRKFVIAYATNGGNAIQACKAAGYLGTKMSGWRLLQRSDVQDALRELCEYELKSLTPAALMRMRQVLDDPNHKDHARTIFAVLDRTGLHAISETKTTVAVDDKHLTQAIKMLAGELGLDAKRLLGGPKVVDAEVVEVDELADVL
jgi:phage terminase small subunit